MAGKISDDDDIIADINVTPLVDIMLVLLIIFMLTSEAVTDRIRHPAIEVDLPKAASAEKEPTRPLSIVISKDGQLFLNGTETTESALIVQVQAAVKERKEVQAVLSADRRVTHGSVVRVIDLVRLQGVEDVAINTKEQEIE